MLPSTSKPSTSNWLDRLRTSKGFPDTAAVDLDHFLSSPNPDPDPPPPDLPAPPPSARHPPSDTKNRLSDILTNALADLFIIGPPRPRQTLAEPKKQRRPKQIHIAAAASGGGSFSADNARRLRTKTRKREAGGAGDVDLSGYSRTDVTVIDTSLGSWKVEKVIFRKGAVWKVRDRKVRVRFRKRRKVGLVERLVGEKERGEESGSGKAAGVMPTCDLFVWAEDMEEVVADDGGNQAVADVVSLALDVLEKGKKKNEKMQKKLHAERFTGKMKLIF